MRYTIYTLALLFVVFLTSCNTPTAIAPGSHQSPNPSKTQLQRASSPPCVIITADKMNVMYMGVENPLYVMIPGIPPDSVFVSVRSLRDEATIQNKPTVDRRRSHHYNILSKNYETLNVDVLYRNKIVRTLALRVKPIPNPTARFGKTEGMIGAGEFKAQQGLITHLEYFDFDATCSIVGYELTHIMATGDKTKSVNTGNRITDETAKLVHAAKPGDTYLFTNISAKCPGDRANRKISSLVYQIR
jgi:hypothetical protein